MTKYVKNALESYVSDRYHPGSFLVAVLSNDLKRSCELADDINRYSLAEIVTYIYNNIPMLAWGDKDAVKNWLEGTEMENTL